jgi:hypothetical protein
MREGESLWLRLSERWRKRRSRRRNADLLAAGQLLPDDPEAEQETQRPATDVFSWLGRNPR